MRKLRLLCFLVLLGFPLPWAALAGDATRPAPIELDAIERFWPVYEALRADREPEPEIWDALFSTHAWRVLGQWRVDKARERYTLAFRPSLVKEYEAAIARGDYEARVLQHLHGMIANETCLRAYHARLAAGDASMLDVEVAIERASEYLPAGAASRLPRPRVTLAVFEPDGYGDATVVLDLAYSEHWGPRISSALAHELHHAYQQRLVAPFDRPDHDSADALLLETVFQLQREGIANLVDKKGTPVSPDAAMTPEQAARLESQVANAPETLAALDAHLARMTNAHPDDARAIAHDIRWKVLPQSGHPAGLFMAMAIRDAAGKQALTATLHNPFAFIRAYNDAMRTTDGMTLGPQAMAVLEALERRIFDGDSPQGSE